MKKKTLPVIALVMLGLSFIYYLFNLTFVNTIDFTAYNSLGLEPQYVTNLVLLVSITIIIVIAIAMITTIIAIKKNSKRSNVLYLIASFASILTFNIIPCILLLIQFFKKPDLDDAVFEETKI